MTSFSFLFCNLGGKCELAQTDILSGGTHLNWLHWFKMVNLFDCCWLCSIFTDLLPYLPWLEKLHVFFHYFLLFLHLRFSPLLQKKNRWKLNYFSPFAFIYFLSIYSVLAVFFWCISLLYLTNVVGFSFIASQIVIGSTRLAPSL